MLATNEVWHTGVIVKLTGNLVEVYGGYFWTGTYSSGHKRGKEVLISDKQMKTVYPKTHQHLITD